MRILRLSGDGKSKRKAPEMNGKIRIGTSGWHYKHWVSTYYPAKFPASKMLDFYAQHFDTVEINNSFYRLPALKTVALWRDTTPGQFCFAMKASRFITHNKKLKDPVPAIDRVLPLLETLGPKVGPLLFQLPPKWELNLERLKEFLSVLPGEYSYAFEFRNHSWHTEPVYRLLREKNAAFCAYHLAGFLSPLEITADFAYLRLHGPDGAYAGSYTAAALARWATRVVAWASALKAVFVYFDNDQSAFAANNARQLKDLVEKRKDRKDTQP